MNQPPSNNSVKVIFLIPFFNEKTNLINLHKSITSVSKQNGFLFKIIYLNDKSSDNSGDVILKYIEKNSLNQIMLMNNDENMGHGRSLMKLCKHTIQNEKDYDYVVTLDSDFDVELEHFKELLTIKGNTIGKRKRFEEGFFRSLITLSAEIIVLLKTGKFWRDSNCPFRIYDWQTFKTIFMQVPSSILTPNIVSTILFLNLNIKVHRINLRLLKQGLNDGITWKGKFRFTKYIKLISFSYIASKELIKFKSN